MLYELAKGSEGNFVFDKNITSVWQNEYLYSCYLKQFLPWKP